MTPQDTQDLMPKNPTLEDVFPKANLGTCQIFHLRNLNLMKAWEYTRVFKRQRECIYGHKDTETVTQNANITAKELSNVSPIGKNTHFSLQYLPRRVHV